MYTVYTFFLHLQVHCLHYLPKGAPGTKAIPVCFIDHSFDYNCHLIFRIIFNIFLLLILIQVNLVSTSSIIFYQHNIIIEMLSQNCSHPNLCFFLYLPRLSDYIFIKSGFLTVSFPALFFVGKYSVMYQCRCIYVGDSGTYVYNGGAKEQECATQMQFYDFINLILQLLYIMLHHCLVSKKTH